MCQDPLLPFSVNHYDLFRNPPINYGWVQEAPSVVDSENRFPGKLLLQILVCNTHLHLHLHLHIYTFGSPPIRYGWVQEAPSVDDSENKFPGKLLLQILLTVFTHCVFAQTCRSVKCLLDVEFYRHLY